MFPFSLAQHFACLFLAGASAEQGSDCQQRLAMPAPIGTGSAMGFTLESADWAGTALKACHTTWILLWVLKQNIFPRLGMFC